MKRMIAGAALVATLMGISAPAYAETAAPTESQVTVTAPEVQPNTLPQVSLTPDQFFYFVKLWVEKVQVVLTRDTADRAALLEQQAQVRLAEATAMAEAGKTDLAQKALEEAQARLQEAESLIGQAAQAGNDLKALASTVQGDQVLFAQAASDLLSKLPEEVRTKLEPIAAELLLQVAENGDALNPDEVKEEAEEAAEEAGITADIAPRTLLVLKAMAEASGKDLSEVVALYEQNPGLGRIAQQLGLKMNPVQHAAQVEWKKAQKGDEESTQAQPADAAATEEQQAPTKGEKAPVKAEKAQAKGDQAPGKSGQAPGKTGQTPGQSGQTPGKSGQAPGKSNH